MESDIGLWGVPLAMLGGAIRVSTPFIFVSLGETITERSGRINLGLEGTLVFGAIECALAELLTSSFQSVDELGSLFPARLLKDNPEQHEYGAN